MDWDIANTAEYKKPKPLDIICPKCNGVAFRQVNFPPSLGDLQLVDFEFSEDTLNTNYSNPRCDSCKMPMDAADIRRQISSTGEFNVERGVSRGVIQGEYEVIEYADKTI